MVTRMNALGFFSVVVLVGASSCAATQNAAKRDPMQCERDPACARQRGTYADCTKQCQDNPDCLDRCREAQMDRGLGH
jgi:hypothetical protein